MYWGVCWVDDGVDGVRELLTDSRRGSRGILPVGGAPLRMEGFEAVRVDGKDDNEVWRLGIALFVLPVVPLVEGL